MPASWMEAILDPEAKEGLLPISFLQSIGEAYTLLRYLIETEWMKVTEMYNGGISWNPLLQLRRKMKRAFFMNASVEFVRFSKRIYYWSYIRNGTQHDSASEIKLALFNLCSLLIMRCVTTVGSANLIMHHACDVYYKVLRMY